MCSHGQILFLYKPFWGADPGRDVHECPSQPQSEVPSAGGRGGGVLLTEIEQPPAKGTAS